MTVTDPFATHADEAQQAPTDPWASDAEIAAAAAAPAKKAPAKKVAAKVEAAPAESKHVVTLKGGAGFDAPWYVIHAESQAELEQLFNGDGASRTAALIERIHAVAQHFLKASPSGATAAPARAAAPAPAQQPPANAPAKPGDGWEYKTGASKKTGKPWQAWMPPRGSNESPVFW